ncbi:MAG: tRNA (adenosine(37)-N6)-threonylcarbamoyltransferase complex ATPase subunit type 1 TsaE [Labedaea sp.]
MSDERFAVLASGLECTAAVAARLAALLRPGDVVLLTGDLAAGKTTFVHAVAKAMGSADPVTSPTFALAQFYSFPAGLILHIDTYRMSDVDEYRDLGLGDFTDTSVNLIEWGELVRHEFDHPLTVHLRQTSDQEREITITGTGERWAGALATLRHELTRSRP